MYKIAVCEDNSIHMNQILNVLKRYEQKHSVEMQIATFQSAELLLQTRFDSYDLVLLDINLAKLNGIELAKYIRKQSKRIKIVFLTAYEHFWPEGYKVLASRFLVKPLSDDELYNEISPLLDEVNCLSSYVLVSEKKELVRVEIDDILYFEISGRKVLVHTLDGIYTSSKSLSYWVKELASASFVQTHSSYLVHLKYVKRVGKDCVTLTTGDEVYISFRKYKSFKESFIRYVSEI